MRLKTNGLILEYIDGELFEIRPLTARRPGKTSRGKGTILGFGVFTGQCVEEVPSVTSQEPEIGLQLFFQKQGAAGNIPDFVSGKITKIIN